MPGKAIAVTLEPTPLPGCGSEGATNTQTIRLPGMLIIRFISTDTEEDPLAVGLSPRLYRALSPPAAVIAPPRHFMMDAYSDCASIVAVPPRGWRYKWMCRDTQWHHPQSTTTAQPPPCTTT